MQVCERKVVPSLIRKPIVNKRGNLCHVVSIVLSPCYFPFNVMFSAVIAVILKEESHLCRIYNKAPLNTFGFRYTPTRDGRYMLAGIALPGMGSVFPGREQSD